MINSAIQNLIHYGIHKNLIQPSDEIYIRNQLMQLLSLEEYPEEDFEPKAEENLESILEELLTFACEKGLIENTPLSRDLFDTRIMGCLVPRPSEVIHKFQSFYSSSPKEATDFFYKFSQDTDYIRRYRIIKDQKWVTKTPYGLLDITINLSKPEKDPKDIAAAKSAPQKGYPKCLLCPENVGYSGRIDHPARQNHRIIPIKLSGEKWGFQYSPYVYYNEHSIIFRMQHSPMTINHSTFGKLFDFVDLFPHYFVGSNADLPIVGGSILSHEHFQGGRYPFAMEQAQTEKTILLSEFSNTEMAILKWPLSVIRLSGKDRNAICLLGNRILTLWRGYSDESVSIYAQTDGEPHNTITPIARKKEGVYELDLVLRNNLTTAEHPLGLFHPHEKLHHIKKENIGLIEVMGLAVLPARLEKELTLLSEAILEQKSFDENPIIGKHSKWVSEFLPKYEKITKENLPSILEQEVGLVFMQVLEDAGVFKWDSSGRQAFQRLLSHLCKML